MEAASAAVGEVVKYGVGTVVAVGVVIARLWLDVRDARRERDAFRADLAAHRTTTAGMADLARAAAVEAMMAAEAEARRKGDDALGLRLDRVETDLRAMDRAQIARDARDEARRGEHG